MKKKYTYAGGLALKLRTPAICSHAIHWIDDLRPQPVVLYIRVSSPKQTPNLPGQKMKLIAELEARGFQVAACFVDVESGWSECRTNFLSAIFKAKRMNAIVVAECVNRLWRSYRKKDRTIPPLSIVGLERLLFEADGVPLATLLHPNTPEGKVRGFQTKRGQEGKGRRGGRPKELTPIKARRLRLSPVAVKLRDDRLSFGQIAKKLRLPKTTVAMWIKREKSARPLSSGGQVV